MHWIECIRQFNWMHSSIQLNAMYSMYWMYSSMQYNFCYVCSWFNRKTKVMVHDSCSVVWLECIIIVHIGFVHFIECVCPFNINIVSWEWTLKVKVKVKVKLIHLIDNLLILTKWKDVSSKDSLSYKWFNQVYLCFYDETFTKWIFVV